MVVPILTFWGMVEAEPAIMENLDLPEGMDNEVLKNLVKQYAGNNECRYDDPDELNVNVHMYCKSRKNDWDYMWKALHAEYNPIENTDRYEDYWRTYESSTKEGTETQISGESSGSNTRTPNLTTENRVSAFDSSNYEPRNQTEERGNENSSSESNSSQKASQDVEGNRNDTEKHGLHSHGNIGVTTNQEMIQQELELRKFNIYKSIAMEFEDEFTIPVYERRCYNYVL